MPQQRDIQGNVYCFPELDGVQQNLAFSGTSARSAQMGPTARMVVLCSTGGQTRVRYGFPTGVGSVTGSAVTGMVAGTLLNALPIPVTAGMVLDVNKAFADAFIGPGGRITAVASGAVGNNQVNVTDTVATLMAKIDVLSGNSVSGQTASTLATNQITLRSDLRQDLVLAGTMLASIGHVAGTTQRPFPVTASGGAAGMLTPSQYPQYFSVQPGAVFAVINADGGANTGFLSIQECT
jgi:hypothetical protein